MWRTVQNILNYKMYTQCFTNTINIWNMNQVDSIIINLFRGYNCCCSSIKQNSRLLWIMLLKYKSVVFMCVCVHMHVYVYASVHVFLYIHVSVYVGIYACIYLNLWICVSVIEYVCSMFVSMCVFMYRNTKQIKCQQLLNIDHYLINFKWKVKLQKHQIYSR